MLPKTLSGKALRHLRGLGHALDPVIAVGKNGVTEALVKETSRALEKHELIKVRVMQEAPVDRHEAAEDLGDEDRVGAGPGAGADVSSLPQAPEEAADRAAEDQATSKDSKEVP